MKLFTNLKKISLNSFINYTFILYAFSLPLSRAGIVFFSALLVLAPFFDKEIISKIKEVFTTKLVKVLIIFISLFFISLLWTKVENLKEAFQYAVKFWYFLPIFTFAIYLKKEFLTKVLSSFFIAMFISELISYGIFFEFWTTKHGTPSDPTPFMNHLDYSIFLAIVSLLAFDKFIYTKEFKYKIIYFLFFVSVTINLFITGGRIGQLAFF